MPALMCRFWHFAKPLTEVEPHGDIALTIGRIHVRTTSLDPGRRHVPAQYPMCKPLCGHRVDYWSIRRVAGSCFRLPDLRARIQKMDGGGARTYLKRLKVRTAC